jgi:hypothetical protein
VLTLLFAPQVRPPQERTDLGTHEVDLMKDKACYVGFLYPAQNEDLVRTIVSHTVEVENGRIR